MTQPATPTQNGAFDEEALAEAYENGLTAEKAGDRATAIEAFRAALAIDPEDRCGASVRLAALGAAEAPDGAPPAYVATLFDQHAELFDAILVEQLGYDAPLQARDAVLAREASGRPTRFERMLDLGCGTGLCAEAFRDRVAHATGLDLSEEMVAVADEKDVYDALFVGDALAFLLAAEEIVAPDPTSWDLVTATDVLPYLGELAPFFAAVAARLKPDGLFVFSSESLPEPAFEGRRYMVGAKHRFAHPESVLREASRAAGLTIERLDPIIVRYDEGAPIEGFLGLATRDSHAAARERA